MFDQFIESNPNRGFVEILTEVEAMRIYKDLKGKKYNGDQSNARINRSSSTEQCDITTDLPVQE